MDSSVKPELSSSDTSTSESTSNSAKIPSSTAKADTSSSSATTTNAPTPTSFVTPSITTNPTPTTTKSTVTASSSTTTPTTTYNPQTKPVNVTTSATTSTTSSSTASGSALSSVTISLGVSALQTPPKCSPPLARAPPDTQVVNPLTANKNRPNKPEAGEVSKTEATKTGTTTTTTVSQSTSSTTTTTTSTSTLGGMKRPAPVGSSDGNSSGSSISVLSSDPPADSSDSDPKKKKQRKDAPKDNRSESPSNPSKSAKLTKGSSSTPASDNKVSGAKDKPVVTTAPPTTTTTETTAAANKVSSNMSAKTDVAGDNGADDCKKTGTAGAADTSGPGPKVPPLKIVLQPGAAANPVSTAQKEKEEEVVPPTTSSSGFPYIVSSTTGDTTDGKEGSEVKIIEDSKDSKSAPKTTSVTTSSTPASTSVVDSTASSEAQKPPAVTSSATSSSASLSSTTVSTTASTTTPTANVSTNAVAEKEGKGRKETVSPPVVVEVVTAAGKGKNEEGPSKEKEHLSKKEKQSAQHSNEDKSEKETSKDVKEHLAVGPKEKPTRVTRRSSHRILEKHGASHTPNSPSSISPKTSACPSPSTSQHGDDKHDEKMDTSEALVELHPRKRKLKHPKETSAPAASTSNAAHADKDKDKEKEEVAGSSTAQQQSDPAPMMNCFEMWFNIRKQIARRRRNLFPVTPKPPKGFKDYLMNRGTYVLQGNPNAQMSVPLLNPPSSLNQQMKDTFVDQEKGRHKLRLQHLVEKEKLVLAVEQEILRVHGRAARALSNQTLPFSVCTILKDEEVYNLLTPEQEEKDITARSRYNGRLFLSWLQDVDDKWDKIKEQMLLRHHNEAESLHAVQKMDWEWKMKEFGLCEPKAIPLIEEHQVPMVHVSDDFDLLPA